jgi:hypothetical protein
MLIINETLIVKIGFLGTANEAVLAVPFQIDSDLSMEENTANFNAASAAVGLAMSEEIGKKFAPFLMKNSGLTADDLDELLDNPEDLTEEEIAQIKQARDYLD